MAGLVELYPHRKEQTAKILYLILQHQTAGAAVVETRLWVAVMGVRAAVALQPEQ